MIEVSSNLTVYFEDPFWVGVYEREEGGHMQAAKITFGAEPRDYEVYAFLLSHFFSLNFGPSVRTETAAKTRINPKRMQRAVSSQIHKTGVGTKAQEALKLQHEQKKKESKENSRTAREQEQARQYQLRQEKKKEKHRGR